MAITSGVRIAGLSDGVWRPSYYLYREGIRDLKNVFVCSKHFLDEEIQTSFSIHQPDGTYLEVPAKPKLQKDAVPRFLPGCLLHLSSSSDTIPPRFDRSLREQHLIDTAINESLLQYNQDKELFQITTLEDLVSKTKHSGLPNHWLVWSSDDNSFNLLKPSITNNNLIAIRCSLTITETLHTMGFYEGIRIPLSLTQINDIRQLNDLLKEIENHSAPTNSPETFQHHVREATGSIRKAIDSLSTGEESGNQQPLLSSLQFILCQLDNALIAKTMRRYNIETLVLSLKCQLISPVCYTYLQSLDCLSLPHLSTLKRLYSNFGLDSEFTNYLKQSVTQFNKWERNVVIQMDEIHVKSTFTYKGDFENIQVASTAVFEEIRKLYKSDQHSVAKLAPRLTSKACWPSTLERQNVSLALRIFDESTAAALNVSYQSRYQASTNSQTADFITIICNVWKIFNINTPNKGILHKDEFSVPLTYNDTRFMFLQRVVDWAECWRVIPDKRAGYSVHAYYKHSTKCQSCLLFLTENKEMEIEEPSDSEYRLIQIIDRGSLKWPSSDVIDAIITLWKVFSSIESQPSIFNNIITGPSRSILIQLTISLIEDEQAEVWRVLCDECGTLMWDVLAKLLTATSNCLISNKIKYMNSQLPLKPCVENTRKLKKLKPN
ncbi:hypothetical protein LOD99_15097 [Oopsacas minuta]|uniref:Transposable element P transposase-like GTP-binding insertion domain-containing protein n=1 Tax=Oopsacas minuta TaxID=111878 RepID=A0AAV7KC04_9METZ|nr:hypothetical protein LOD99_15097 [Oopsacas minuta]